MNAVNTLSEAQILAQLQALTQGLYYRSESDYPLEVVQYIVPVATELTITQARAFLQAPTSEPMEIKDLPYFFRPVTKGGDADPESMPNRFRALAAFLEQQLEGLKVYRLGKYEIQTYVLGKLNPQTYIGLKTTVIETE